MNHALRVAAVVTKTNVTALNFTPEAGARADRQHRGRDPTAARVIALAADQSSSTTATAMTDDAEPALDRPSTSTRSPSDHARRRRQRLRRAAARAGWLSAPGRARGRWRRSAFPRPVSR